MAKKVMTISPFRRGKTGATNRAVPSEPRPRAMIVESRISTAEIRDRWESNRGSAIKAAG
ncbi:unannotated protein [freshwater metagenome]|uniref:Unannotated protein n=1 Tax=freshwater metagenome TaxID=449393 RepID=A0A6J6IXN1_9ZZZZ